MVLNSIFIYFSSKFVYGLSGNGPMVKMDLEIVIIAPMLSPLALHLHRNHC